MTQQMLDLVDGLNSEAVNVKVNEGKCHARVWMGGFGGQCTRDKKDGCLCSVHKNGLLFGLINGPRPETPVKNGKTLTWQPEHVCSQVRAYARIKTYQRLIKKH